MTVREMRLKFAHNAYIQSRGDIDAAMRHPDMPYRTKKVLRAIVREKKWHDELGLPAPTGSKKAPSEVARMHDAFMQSRGNMAAASTECGIPVSTIRRYAIAGNWREHVVDQTMDQAEPLACEPSQLELPPPEPEDEDTTTADLKLMRARLIAGTLLLGGTVTDATYPGLAFAPRNLAEAIKAILDLDKRISEREGERPVSVWGPYASILARCAQLEESP